MWLDTLVNCLPFELVMLAAFAGVIILSLRRERKTPRRKK